MQQDAQSKSNQGGISGRKRHQKWSELMTTQICTDKHLVRHQKHVSLLPEDPKANVRYSVCKHWCKVIRNQPCLQNCQSNISLSTGWYTNSFIASQCSDQTVQGWNWRTICERRYWSSHWCSPNSKHTSEQLLTFVCWERRNWWLCSLSLSFVCCGFNSKQRERHLQSLVCHVPTGNYLWKGRHQGEDFCELLHSVTGMTCQMCEI